jgi:hypothetical protein
MEGIRLALLLKYSIVHNIIGAFATTGWIDSWSTIQLLLAPATYCIQPYLLICWLILWLRSLPCVIEGEHHWRSEKQPADC